VVLAHISANIAKIVYVLIHHNTRHSAVCPRFELERKIEDNPLKANWWLLRRYLSNEEARLQPNRFES